MPELQTSFVYNIHRLTLQSSSFFLIRRNEERKVAYGEKKKETVNNITCLVSFSYRIPGILWCENTSLYLYGELPKEVSVEWSLLGIKSPLLSDESQSQSTPDSAGGLFTQPQKSISKSQKPARSNTEANTVHSLIDMIEHAPQPPKNRNEFLAFICFLLQFEVCSGHWPGGGQAPFRTVRSSMEISLCGPSPTTASNITYQSEWKTG